MRKEHLRSCSYRTVYGDLKPPRSFQSPPQYPVSEAGIRNKRQVFRLLGDRYPQIPTASLIPDCPPCRQGESPDNGCLFLFAKIEQENALCGNFYEFFLIAAIKGCSKRLYKCKRNERAKRRTVLKGAAMFKSIRTHLRAAVTLIAVENLKALRVLLKSLMESVSKSSRQYKKT